MSITRRLQKQLKLIREGLGLEKSDVMIPFSAETKQGREEIWEYLEGADQPGENELSSE